MSGIAGSTREGARREVESMLAKIAHRGPAGHKISVTPSGTLGVAWTAVQATAGRALQTKQAAQDSTGSGRMAQAVATSDGFTLMRDRLGIAPLYFDRSSDGTLYFASEVKALLTVSRNPRLLPPGYRHAGGRLTAYSKLTKQPPLAGEPQIVAKELRELLAAAVQERINGDEVGCWLSGGLDSSAIAVLARPQVKTLHTFAAGLAGASDIEHAREVAQFIGSDHHEVIVSFGEMLAVLPAVIYHLESFDALLVRSSIINYLAGRVAAEYVPAVLSGEGGDELFAGYAYLKELERDRLADELLDITGRLHNTALQRVDRCSAAHGLLAYVPFLALAVVDFALRIPVDFKLRKNVEKWIVRQAMTDLLPPGVLYRTKSKFWEGAGVGDLLAQHAEDRISDRDFMSERVLWNGWRLRTKEELMYYRIFREHFGELDSLDWMGRTKGAPEA